MPTETIEADTGNGIADPALSDDPAPDPRFKEIALSEALADALKPIAPATEEIWSPDPAKKQARDAIVQAYTAATATNGPLKAKYDAAADSFKRAASDLTSTTAGGTARLDTWLAAYLDKGKPLYDLFAARAALTARLVPRGGSREAARAARRGATTGYADAYKAWSDPIGSIDAQIGASTAEIDQLNADINVDRDADYAIYKLWFDYAPRLLRLSATAPDNTSAPGIDLVKAKLADFPERLDALKAGPDQADDGVFMLPADKLAKTREDVLDAWKAAAKAQAEAEAEFALRPDDTAALVARLDGAVKGEADAVKVLLVPPAHS